MRNKSLTMVAALLLTAGGANAQDTTAAVVQPDVVKAIVPASLETPLVNQIDFGVRGTAFGSGSDQARFQRYRDMRGGGTLDLFRLFKDTSQYRYSLQAKLISTPWALHR